MDMMSGVQTAATYQRDIEVAWAARRKAQRNDTPNRTHKNGIFNGDTFYACVECC